MPKVQMRDRIKSVATELLIRNGYQGFRFRDIAARLKTTRANVHYYFGNKKNLCDEVVVNYVDETIRRYESIWRNPDSTLESKIFEMIESNRSRYNRYNPKGNTGKPWSLIARMRLEREIIGDKASKALLRFNAVLEEVVPVGVAIAIKKKEIRADAPVEDIALQLVSIANSADPITQDAGSFERLEQLYRAFARIVNHAYGLRKSTRSFRVVQA
jgi:TetR/AcrR family transcriptional regulator, transcriptional repressor for nem operon